MASLRVVTRSVSRRILPQSAVATQTLKHSIRLFSTRNNGSYSNSNNRNQQNNNRRYVRMGMTAAVGLGVIGTVFAADKPTVDYNAVRKDIADILDAENYDDGSYGPVFVRLAWHASGTFCKNTKTGGSNGATMRYDPESKHGANAGLHVAREKLEKIKKKYPGLSYADLWTLAGVVAIEEMGGPKISWRSGRSDAPDNKTCPPNGRLPDADKKHEHIRTIFYRMGFDDREIVALIGGGHALGRCHKDRSGYDGPWTRAPTTFSNEFFRLLLEEKWTQKKWTGPLQFENSKTGSDLMMLPADLALLEDKEFRKHVELYSKDRDVFFADFARAFGKLLELGVKFPDVKPETVAAAAPAAAPAAKSKEANSKSWWQKIFG